MADDIPSRVSPLRDPRKIYPSPPFDRQPQDKPGLDQSMQPRPDHGEDTYRGTGRMQGRKALITGGDSGIGRAVAIAYAREGAHVAINYLPDEEPDVDDLCEVLARDGLDLVRIPGDIRDRNFCNTLVSQTVDRLGGLDTLINNAGWQVFQESILDISPEQLSRTFETNIYAMFWITQAAIPHLLPGATIINTTSTQGSHPSSTLLDYASTKFAIIGFTQALSQELIKKGVRVNAVAPGPFWTALQPSGGQSQEKVMHFGEQTPYGRPGQPAEIAPVYVFLATEDSSYVPGEPYGVTGGKPL